MGSFQHFQKNSFEVDETIDPLVAINPFTQYGELWKERRSQVVPAFTQTKIRSCFPIIKNVAENFLDYVTKNRKTNPDFEAKDVSLTFKCSFKKRPTNKKSLISALFPVHNRFGGQLCVRHRCGIVHQSGLRVSSGGLRAVPSELANGIVAHAAGVVCSEIGLPAAVTVSILSRPTYVQQCVFELAGVEIFIQSSLIECYYNRL